MATLIGGVGAVVVFFPRIVVSPPSAVIDPRNAVSVSFDITNTGIIPLLDVSASLGIGQMVMNGKLDRAVPSFDTRLFRPEWGHHRLGMDERFTMVLSDMIGLPIEAADIGIVVDYNPWHVPIRRRKVFRFVAAKGYDSEPRWKSWPLGERPPPD